MGQLALIPPGSNLEEMAQVDPWVWVWLNELILFGGPYRKPGHEFQIPIWQNKSKRKCAKKSPQMGGFTEMFVCKIIHGLIYRQYPQGALCLFPTEDEVRVFSKTRFRTLIRNNPQAIGRFVRDTDSTEVKRVGDASLFFRGSRLKDVEGAQKSSSKLKSLPVDVIMADEVDEMEQGALELVKGRMDHSKVQEEIYLANATVPDYGIDKLYQQSDQRVWTIECPKCGRENVLELQFPDCLQRAGGSLSGPNLTIRPDAGRVYRACRKCRAELNPGRGYWVAQYPARSVDMVGWWISHLNSAFTSPAAILSEWEDPEMDRVRFYNRRLAMAHVAAENKLERNDVYLCCGQDAMAMSSPGPCGMGVDVGKTLHVLIGQRVSTVGIKVLKAVRVQTFEDVWDLAQCFRVASVVFDAYPELHKVREFCAKAPYSAFGCAYSEEQRGVAAWDEKSKVVTVNRTELCDTTHKIVVTAGRLELPRRDAEIEEVAAECCNTAKIFKEDKKTGVQKAYYIKLGADHYRHALNYLALAISRVRAVDKGGFLIEQPVDFYYG